MSDSPALCEWERSNGMAEPPDECRRDAKYLVQTDHQWCELDLVKPLKACDWHVLELAYYEGWAKFTVTDIRGEAQKEQDAADYVASLQEEQATEGDPF